MIKFSIIIPIYNAEKYIEKCIYSILNQDYPNIEVILVNDGSTDNSDSICKTIALKDSRVVYHNQINQGPSIARQNGLSLAKGDYISFVDSDDFIKQGLYSEIVDICEQGADIVEFGYYSISENDKKLCELLPEEKEGIDCLAHYVYQKNTTNYLCNKVFKKNLFDFVEFPELYLSEDQCILTQLYYYAKKIVTIKNAYYNYVLNPVSLCNSPFKNRTMDVLKANDFIYDFLKKNNIEFAAVQSIMGVNSAILVYNKLDLSYFEEDKVIYEKEILDNYHKWLKISKDSGVYHTLSYKQKLKWFVFKWFPKIISQIRKRMAVENQ